MRKRVSASDTTGCRAAGSPGRRFPLRRYARPAALLAIWLVVGCGTTVSSWPLRRGQSTIAIEAGGPVANISGIQFPVPYPVGRWRYGLTDRLGVHAGAHLLMPLFGTAGGEAGFTYHFLDQRNWLPCLGVGVGAIGLAEFDGGGGTALFPTVELTASYLRPGHSLSYLGVHTMYQFHPKFFMTYSPYVGHNFLLGDRLSLNVETKWYAGYERTTPRAVRFTLPIANHGGLGFAFGLVYHFRGWYE